jgi:ectoine hydroxylase-related dioxygenase (phytanoyl-CoA dioxygenase family)
MAAPFRESTAHLDDARELTRRIEQDGYLFFRGLLEPAELDPVRGLFLEKIEERGWLARDTPAEEARLAIKGFRSAHPSYYAMQEAVLQLEEFHALAHAAPIVGLFERLLGDEILVHPNVVARMNFPGPDMATAPHQDHYDIRGTTETYTAWIPLHDCPSVRGSLEVAAGSHRRGLCEVGVRPGQIEESVLDPEPGIWTGGDFRLGDVLIFHSLTVHRSAPNLTNRLRLSVDYRYQRVRDPVDLRLVTLRSPKLSWENIYAGWKSDRHKYYWRKWNLNWRFGPAREPGGQESAAFALGEAGDPSARIVLERLSAMHPDAALRARAAELLGRLEEASVG